MFRLQVGCFRLTGAVRFERGHVNYILMERLGYPAVRLHKIESGSKSCPYGGRILHVHIDNPQEQWITVAPLNVEEQYRSAGVRRKSYLFPTTKVSQVLVDYALNKYKEQGG